MAAYALPVLAALLVWWLSTGVILLLHRLPRASYRWSFLGACLVSILALYVLVVTREQTGSAAAYGAFLAAVALWGWLELAFLQGLITGPRKIACPGNASPPKRFFLAVRTLLYHELALIATLGLVAVLTWGHANQIGLWTFLALFCMRLSAKLNIFLGVPHLTEEFLPQSLSFLKSYFGRKPMNALFPLSVTLATLLAAYVFHLALAPEAGALAVTGNMLIGSMIVLGTLEHWFLVLPLRDSLLWRWALREGRESEGSGTGLFFRPGSGPATNDSESAPISAVPSDGRF